MTCTETEQAYSLGHGDGIIAHHEHRRVTDAAAYLLKPLEEVYGDRVSAQLRFLDVGCGPGSITIDFAQSYYPNSHFTGIDFTDEALDRARAASKAVGVANVEFRIGDVQKLQFPDNTFDVVYCSQVLQHVADPVKALAEMRRVCKPGGIVGAKEGYAASWYPKLPGLQAKWDLTQRVSRARGSNPDPGSYIHVLARRGGFKREQIKCSADVWLFSSKTEREYWGGNWMRRLDPDGNSAFVSNVLEGGFATRSELKEMQNDFAKWVKDEDGWYTFHHGEIVCRKE